MKIDFDTFNNIEEYELYLCNPNKNEICAIHGINGKVILRLNNLSELTLDIPKYIKSSIGNQMVQPCYDLLQGKRLILIKNIGYFEIIKVIDNDDESGEIKSITAESHQYSLQHRTEIAVEERVYKFYNSADEYDDKYVSSDTNSVPSVVGQLNKQLGIKLDLKDTDEIDDETFYDDWTITYIEDVLMYGENGNDAIYRSFNATETNGYDFMVNVVEQAFEIIWMFDFLHHSIQVKTIASVTKPTDIYLSFDNLVQKIELTENAENIKTVLYCSGDNLDIRKVNQSGTNYIVNFDYYMDKDGKWMSDELIRIIENWKEFYETYNYIENPTDGQSNEFTDAVKELYNEYKIKSSLRNKNQKHELKVKDLENARDNYLKDKSSVDENTLNEEIIIITSEDVEIGENSLDCNSNYYKNSFSKEDETIYKCYKDIPKFTEDKFIFNEDDEMKEDTLTNCGKEGYFYYLDESINSYCKIKMGTEINEDNNEKQFANGFLRYTTIKNATNWIDLHTEFLAEIKSRLENLEKNISIVEAKIENIADKCNIQNYIKNNGGENSEKLLNELKTYWIEGLYENTNYKVTDETPFENTIELALELKIDAEKQIKRVSQPSFNFNINSLDFTKLPQFKKFSKQLELGRTILVEKSNGILYNPAVTGISFNLDDSEGFELTFSNSLKLNENEFTFAELIAESSKVADSVISNWNELFDYTKNKDIIGNLLAYPLDRTLRAGKANMALQEFTVDDTGILGRKFEEGNQNSFEKEQIRLMNNMILFTDDNWETIRTALGKIYRKDEDNNTIVSYGLIADTIIGNLIMGENLKIQNENSSIILDKNGLIIKKILEDDNGEKSEINVFNANTSGDLSLTGEIKAISGYIGNETNGFLINDNSLSYNFFDENKNILTNKDRILVSSGSLKNSCSVSNSDKRSDWMLVAGNNFGVTSSGDLFATSGKIAGLNLEIKEGNEKGLYSEDFKLITKPQGENTEINGTGLFFFHLDDDDNEILDTILTRDTIKSSNINTKILMVEESINSDTILVNNIILSDNLSLNCIKETDNSGELYTATLTIEGGYQYKDAKAVITLSGNNNGKLLEGRYFDITLRSDTWAHNEHKFQIWIDANSNRGEYDTNWFWGISAGWFTTGGEGTTSINFYQNDKSVGDYLEICGNITPDENDKRVFGRNDYRWNYIYTNNLSQSAGSVTDSDKNVKNTISELTDKHSKMFDLLRPVTFKYNNGNSNRLHMGLIANEFKDSFESVGLSTQDMAAYCSWTKDDGTETCGIRYEELVALNIYEIQKLKNRIAELEMEIKLIKGVGEAV